MTDIAITEQFFSEFMILSKKAFTYGLYKSAYHSLKSALDCARLLDNEARYASIRDLAVEQVQWIDLHLPENMLSTQSALSRRNGVNFYGSLILQSTKYIQYIADRKRRDEQLKRMEAGIR